MAFLVGLGAMVKKPAFFAVRNSTNISTPLPRNPTTNYPNGVFLKSYNTANVASGDVTLITPSTVNGDFVLLCAVCDSSTTTITWPSGFIQGGTNNSTADGQTLAWAYKIANNEPVTYTLVFSTTGLRYAFASVFSGVDVNCPINSKSNNSQSTAQASPASITTGALTASKNDSILLLNAVDTTIAATDKWNFTPPSGYTKLIDSHIGVTQFALSILNNVNAGSTGTLGGTYVEKIGTNPAGWMAHGIALNRAPVTEVTFLGQSSVSNINAGTSLTLQVTYTANEYVFVYCNYGGSSTAPTITDGTNTYTELSVIYDTPLTESFKVFYCANPIAGTYTLTLNTPQGQDFRALSYIRYSGLINAPQTAVTNIQASSTTAVNGVTSTNITPTVPLPALVVGATFSESSLQTNFSAGTGFQSRGNLTGYNYNFVYGGAFEDKKVTSNAAIPATFTADRDDRTITFATVVSIGDPEPTLTVTITPANPTIAVDANTGLATITFATAITTANPTIASSITNTIVASTAITTINPTIATSVNVANTASVSISTLNPTIVANVGPTVTTSAAITTIKPTPAATFSTSQTVTAAITTLQPTIAITGTSSQTVTASLTTINPTVTLSVSVIDSFSTSITTINSTIVGSVSIVDSFSVAITTLQATIAANAATTNDISFNTSIATTNPSIASVIDVNNFLAAAFSTINPTISTNIDIEEIVTGAITTFNPTIAINFDAVESVSLNLIANKPILEVSVTNTTEFLAAVNLTTPVPLIYGILNNSADSNIDLVTPKPAIIATATIDIDIFASSNLTTAKPVIYTIIALESFDAAIKIILDKSIERKTDFVLSNRNTLFTLTNRTIV